MKIELQAIYNFLEIVRRRDLWLALKYWYGIFECLSQSSCLVIVLNFLVQKNLARKVRRLFYTIVSGRSMKP
jgi:hypothetical protein